MSFRIENPRCLAGAFALLLAITLTAAAEAQPPGAAGTTIVVNNLADGNIIVWPGSPLPCMLRDAIRAANTNVAVGGCPAGRAPRVVSANPLQIDFVDRIVFSVGAGTPRIQLRNALPAITEAVTIDGATGGATRIEIAGNQIFNPFGVTHGVTVTGTYATLKSLVVNGFTGHGILLSHLEGDGTIAVTPQRPDRPQPDPGQLPGDPCGPQAFPSDPSQCPPIGGNPDNSPIPMGSGGGGGNTVLNCLIGTNAAGTGAAPNGNGTAAYAGVALLSPGNVVGDSTTGRNVISGNRGHGVLIDGSNNKVIGNSIGTALGSTAALANQFDGIYLGGGQFANASAEIRDNTIANNGGEGVDGGYNRVTILSNRINTNGALGIDRAELGVTPNDASGNRSRPPNYPLLQTSTITINGGTTIFGKITQKSTSPITLQFFYGTTCDPSGYGEGWSYIGQINVAGGAPTLFQFHTNSIFLRGYYTATATTVWGGTSEFSNCLAN